MPQDKSEEIKFFSDNHFGKRRGWGSVRVSASIGGTSWDTSIFPDSKSGAYILPIKFEVRKKQKIVAGDEICVSLQISM